jgi:hypothetical protein
MPLAAQPEQELTQNFVSTDDDPQVAKFPFHANAYQSPWVWRQALEN